MVLRFGLLQPVGRARETARLAGFDAEIDDDLLEWDYGEIEGRRNDEITAERPGWSKWHDEVPGGEQVAEVGERADRVIAGIADAEADVLVFAHGHLFSILIARWLGLHAADGRRFPLTTATVTALSTKRTDRILETLNHRCGHPLDPLT